MIRALSTAATGMNALQTKLDVTANNVSNSSTTGFKKARAEFQDLMYQTTRVPGANSGTNTLTTTGLQVGLGVRTAGTAQIHSEGDLQQTGNPYDVAIEGKGFFVVTMPDGTQAYTRAGNFHEDAQGRLSTVDGYALSSEIVVPPTAESVTIGTDGVVTATLQGETDPVQLGQLELANFTNPAGLQARGSSLFTATAASGTPIISSPGSDGIGSVRSGMLEMSNVKVVEEMINLISGQRAYEVNSRVVQAADEMLQQTANMR